MRRRGVGDAGMAGMKRWMRIGNCLEAGRFARDPVEREAPRNFFLFFDFDRMIVLCASFFDNLVGSHFYAICSLHDSRCLL